MVSKARPSMIVGRFQYQVASVVATSLVLLTASAGFTGHPTEEPNIEIAQRWWPPQRHVWTPVGWKDHYFRFNVVYNGTLLAEPYPHSFVPRVNARQWQGQDLQLTFTSSPRDVLPPLPAESTKLWKLDGGVGVQGWRDDHATPVLWTKWPLQEGLTIRQEVFAHVPGAREVETGIEPIYAWVRLSVTHVDELKHADKMPIAIQVSKVHYTHHHVYVEDDGTTIDVVPNLAPFAKPLTAENTKADGKAGLRLLEADGKVRLVVLPTEPGRLRFRETSPGSRIYGLSIDMLAKVGDYVDLLVPMLPQLSADVDAEQQLGFHGALAECDAYWAKAPSTAARIEVPEEFINRAIAQNLKFAEIIAEKDHKTGDYTFLTGSWGYDTLWSTPTSMTSHMFVDLMGYHDVVARHVELFRKHQGSKKPPGPTYSQHPGYFGTPDTLTSVDWLTDHGAILHQVSKHALLTGDQDFIDEWTDPIVKACDFIKDSCAQMDHAGVKGLLPPAVATDEGVPMQAIWNEAWNYKGLTTAVRLLKQIGHSRAAEFEHFAQQYKAIFVEAYREQSKRAPRWTDAAGQEHPLPPTSLFMGSPEHLYTHAFYLDTGPMVLVWSGLLPADDPLMVSSVKYFREGPNFKLRGARVNPLCRPVLEHEISSCETTYSWNIFHSWQLGDRENFLTGLYAVFTGGISPQTYISGEHRHGIYGNICVFPLAFSMARLAVVDDEIVPAEIHLLRLCPLAWCSSEQQSTFERMPTEFGPVDLKFGLTPDGKTLDVSFEGRWREKPRRVVLHAPPVPGLSNMIVNGKEYPAEGEVEIALE